MGGEMLQQADIGEDGIPGDRIIQVRDARGRVVTSRSRPQLLLHRAALGTDGEPRVDGRSWTEVDVARDVEAAAGPGSRLVRDEGPERFDVLPLLVATDGAVDFLGYDRRRFRSVPVVSVSGIGWSSSAGSACTSGIAGLTVDPRPNYQG